MYANCSGCQQQQVRHAREVRPPGSAAAEAPQAGDCCMPAGLTVAAQIARPSPHQPTGPSRPSLGLWRRSCSMGGLLKPMRHCKASQVQTFRHIDRAACARLASPRGGLQDQQAAPIRQAPPVSTANASAPNATAWQLRCWLWRSNEPLNRLRGDAVGCGSS